MCVDNGMFTVSFLKEGLQKVMILIQLSVRDRADFIFFCCSSVAGWTTCCEPAGKPVRAPTY
jgi:hypothetical protein